ncbi:hypothetical protein FB451DRAFT_1396332 [Mycena latifolia]|nr:hypothetical protein FB451DRAFT_1396332 [Mycena latifolia]
MRDDWEDDGAADEEEPRAPADNQRIWDDANAHAPMPALIVSGVDAAPPLAAFQPAMRILKRPAAPAPARYQQARERIFGREAERGGGKDGAKEGTGEGADKDRDKEKEKKSAGFARNPRGPQPANAAAQKGFKARSGQPPPVRDPGAAAACVFMVLASPLLRPEVPSTVDLDKQSARDPAPSWLAVNLQLPVNRTSTPPTAISLTLTLTPVSNEIERLSRLRQQDPAHPSRCK